MIKIFFLLNALFCISKRSVVVVNHENYDSFNKEMLKKTNKTLDEIELFGSGKFMGCFGDFDAKSLNYLNSHKDVKYVEEIKQAKLSAVQLNPGNDALALISHNKTGRFLQSNVYNYTESAGRLSIVYVIDTGYTQNYKEFGNRAKPLKNFVNDKDYDEIGHGTHVAGIIGSVSYGVAKEVTIFIVKVFSADKQVSNDLIIKAIFFIIEHSKEYNKNNNTVIINMSLGSPYQKAVNDAVEEAYNNGIIVVAAAGNEGVDACSKSPASSAFAITCGNVSYDNKLNPSSNYGMCVNIYAYGTEIKSTDNLNPDIPKILSGTSMSAPHVSGAIALLSTDHKYRNKEELFKELISSSNKYMISTIPNTKKRVLSLGNETKSNNKS